MVEVSSTGDLGYAIRSADRAYINFPYAVTHDTGPRFVYEMGSHLWEDNKHPGNISRMVGRAVIEEPALQEIITENPDLAECIEAAAILPVADDGVQECLVYFARNLGDRAPQDHARDHFRDKLQVARAIAPGGFEDVLLESEEHGPLRLTEDVKSPKQLHELWGPVFEWSLRGCVDFAQSLQAEAQKNPVDRNVWFKGVEVIESGELLACAMAERLDLPSRLGSLALVESSEWAVKPGLRGVGLGRRMVQALGEDVRRDLAPVNSIVIAECNMVSGAHKVALHAGLEAPVLSVGGCQPDQILYNNVPVGDGVSSDEYRTFLFVVDPNSQ